MATKNAAVHMRKDLPGGRFIAQCWKYNVALTTDESAVTCKRCLASIRFNREADAEWQKRKATDPEDAR
jgi:hypothetical protein